jgi:hypothetical protein
MQNAKVKSKRLSDTYRFRGFKPQAKIIGIFGDPKARVVRLERTGKKLSVVPVGSLATVITIAASGEFETSRAGIQKSSSSSRSVASSAKPAGK